MRDSVHHRDFPQADETLIDIQLSQDMEALLRLVSSGSAARNSVKIKVRQPLAELKVQPASDADRRAVERFADQMQEELNLKRVALHRSVNGALLSFEVKPNPKNMGPKYGIASRRCKPPWPSCDPNEVAELMLAGKSIELKCDDGPAVVEPSDLWVLPKLASGFAGVADRGTQLLLDARITPNLHRKVWRRSDPPRSECARMQVCRWKIASRDTSRSDSADLAAAIKTHQAYLAAETLTSQWSDKPLGEAGSRQVKIEKHVLTIELRKVSK